MRALVLLLAMLLAAVPAAAERFYKWTDAEGNVHYTDEPPAEGEYEVMEPAAGGGNDAAPSAAERLEAWRQRQQQAQAAREELEASREEQRRAQQQRRENCDLARENVRQLEQNTRIIMPAEEEGGEPVRMSDEERLQRLETAREAVAEFCDDA